MAGNTVNLLLIVCFVFYHVCGAPNKLCTLLKEGESNLSRKVLIYYHGFEYNHEGTFLLKKPFTFDGTIVSVNASGYCTAGYAATKTQSFVMHLSLYDDNTISEIYKDVPVICDWSTVDYFKGGEVVGRVKSQINMNVKAGQNLAIEFNDECYDQDGRNRDICLFKPAAIKYDDDRGLEFLYTPYPGAKTIYNESVKLQFSYELRTCLPKTSDSGTKDSALILALVLSSMLTVIVVLVVILLFVFIRRRQKRSVRTRNFPTIETNNNTLSSQQAEARKVNSYHFEPRSSIQMTPLPPAPTAIDYCLPVTSTQNDESASSTYEFIRGIEGETELSHEPPSNDSSDKVVESEYYDEPYWEPASEEHELKQQLLKISLTDDHLELSSELGSGEFGVVRRGVWYEGGEEKEVAVKTLADNTSEEKRIQFLQEAAIMGQFNHPNVITLHGIFLNRDPMMIVLEMMHIGNLREYLLTLKDESHDGLPTHTSALLMSFCRNVASGMTYLSGKGFVHRDLAARNILVSRDEVCKIADFGLSRALAEADYYVSRGGKIPVKWTAPEALSYKKYSPSSDVWSFGVVLYEIWTLGVKPYHTMTNTEVYQEIHKGFRLPPPPGCPKAVYQTMIKCWNSEPQLRPSFPEIQVELQRPDFKLLTWTEEDVAAYSKEARTLGAPLEAGKKLYTQIQKTYSLKLMPQT